MKPFDAETVLAICRLTGVDRWTKVQLAERAAPARLDASDEEPPMTPAPVIARCLTGKTALAEAIEGYCNEACRLKVGRTKRAPGRVAARQRRGGGRRL
jgi:hypothetical protein